MTGAWESAPLRDCVDVLDHLRVPVNADERSKRPGKIPYYGATGQVGWIDDYLFDEELLLLGEDGAPFFDKSKPIAYLMNGKTWVNNHAHVLRPRPDIIDPRFPGSAPRCGSCADEKTFRWFPAAPSAAAAAWASASEIRPLPPRADPAANAAPEGNTASAWRVTGCCRRSPGPLAGAGPPPESAACASPRYRRPAAADACDDTTGCPAADPRPWDRPCC